MKNNTYWLTLGIDCGDKYTTMGYKEMLSMSCLMIQDYLKYHYGSSVTLYRRSNGMTIYARLSTPEEKLSLNVTYGYPLPIGASPIHLLCKSPRGMRRMEQITFDDLEYKELPFG